MSTRHYGTSDEGGFYFQSESAASKSARRAEKAKGNAGTPLKLNAKLSAVLRDETEAGVVFVADNGGGVRRIDLKTNKTIQTYRGPRHPITSLTTNPSHTLLFAGSWDKTIWSWNIRTGAQWQRYVGHSDFVNCVTCCHIARPISSIHEIGLSNDSLGPEGADPTLLLLSGSVDATINVWRVSTGERLHTLKGHTRGVLDLAVDPLSSLLTPQSSSPQRTQPQAHPPTVSVFSASSTPEIRHWSISHDFAAETTNTLGAPPESALSDGGLSEEILVVPDSAPLSVHDTSVNKLLFSPSSSSAGSWEYDLFTASSDNTAKCLSRPVVGASTAAGGKQAKTWQASDTFTHPDWVRAIAHDPESGMLVTGCRDEEVRVWDTSSGELVRTFSGHFDSVEGVCLVEGLEAAEEGGQRRNGKKWIVSVSLDGTLRRWKVAGDTDGGEEIAESHEVTENQDEQNKAVGEVSRKVKSLTTEDEDRELAELMAELEDDE